MLFSVGFMHSVRVGWGGGRGRRGEKEKLLTCQREYLQVPHVADVRESEVPELRAPPEVQHPDGGDGRHVPYAQVGHVDAPVGRKNSVTTAPIPLLCFPDESKNYKPVIISEESYGFL
ncbi:hypothetical protein CEXT_666341 [Caerostris extrusa]|uniref:Uncharacterized protein n=1 Tax=Caerostris extrusa TaxID=172846 RepID=A0AAV4MW11_CAEEX|nr:hypothetical protein CEXT_666341 [Caerostris extrusa]